MKRVLVFFIGTVTALFLLEAGLRLNSCFYQRNIHSPVRSFPKDHSKPYIILCLGNFYTLGVGAPPGMSYPAQLQLLFDHQAKYKDVQVINEGIGYQNSAELLKDLRVKIGKYHPTLIVLQTGQTNSWNYLGYIDFLFKERKDISYSKKFAYYFSELLQRSSVYRLFNLFLYNGWRDYFSISSGCENEEKYYKLVKFRENVELGEEMGYVAGPEVMDRRQIDEAFNVFMNAVKTHPGHPQNYYEIGFLYRIQNNYEEAVKWYLKALNAALACRYRSMIINSSLRIRDILLNHKGPNDGIASKQLLRSVYYYIHSNPAQFVYLLGLSESEISKWVGSDIKEIVSIIKQQKIRLIIQNYPIAWPVNSTLSRVAGILQVPFVDNYSVFKKKIAQGVPKEYLFVPDNHCSARGYGLMAENVYNKIMDENFLKVPDRKE